MSTSPLMRLWVDRQGGLTAKPEDGHSMALYAAADIEARDREIVAFLKDFIERNACNEIDGIYKCNQCGAVAIPGQSSHLEDCEILEAKRIVRWWNRV